MALALAHALEMPGKKWGSARFWFTLVALITFVGMQAVYWIVTYPVNKFWLKSEKLDRFGA
jgi:hypothetical protein